jgi:hypothetical protein
MLEYIYDSTVLRMTLAIFNYMEEIKSLKGPLMKFGRGRYQEFAIG